MQPPVRYDTDEIGGWERIQDVDSKHHRVLVLGACILQQEHLMMQNVLPVNIFHYDVKQLDVPVNLDVILKIWDQPQLHPQYRPRDRLDVRAQFQLRKLVDQPVQCPSHFGHAHQLPQVAGGEVGVAGPLDVSLALQFPGHDLGDILELTQGGLGPPDPAGHHVGEGQRELRKSRPAPPQRYLEDGTHDSRCGLLDERHVRDQRESIQPEAGDVRLQQYVDLGGGLAGALLDRDGHPRRELGQFQLLLLPDGDVGKLSAH
mmetsp:Transcript_29309/g.62217  ORF Transcript_29309/g.62217 Transcript_29309/m.62217 type:complete len:260 (+) Transcript_29309:2786-3565(+)